MSTTKYFHAQNSSRTHEGERSRVVFQNYDVFAGTPRGIFEARTEREIRDLEAIAKDQRSGVTEITEREYQFKKAQNRLGPDQSIEDLNGFAGAEAALKHYPPFAKQTKWACGLFPLPPSMQSAYYNCAIAEAGRKQYLVTRHWERKGMRIWDSRIVVFSIEPGMKLRDPIRLEFPILTDYEQFEDPRVTFHEGKFYVCHCSWNRYETFHSRQIFSRFSANWKHEESWCVSYGFNTSKDVGRGHEKNWTWFNHGGQWHMVYRFSPHVVCLTQREIVVREHETEAQIPWAYGEVRGGSNPVPVDGEYWSFFHSSLPWKNRQKRYFMGAYAFRAQPPFAITRVTPEPLFVGSEYDTRILGCPPVMFPCGALFKKDQWLVVGGVNDEACFWARIPHKDLIGKAVTL